MRTQTQKHTTNTCTPLTLSHPGACGSGRRHDFLCGHAHQLVAEHVLAAPLQQERMHRADAALTRELQQLLCGQKKSQVYACVGVYVCLSYWLGCSVFFARM